MEDVPDESGSVRDPIIASVHQDAPSRPINLAKAHPRPDSAQGSLEHLEHHSVRTLHLGRGVADQETALNCALIVDDFAFADHFDELARAYGVTAGCGMTFQRPFALLHVTRRAHLES